MGRSGFGATPINPPLAPFVKGVGPQDRGILPSDCIFIKVPSTQSKISNFEFWKSNFVTLRPPCLHGDPPHPSWLDAFVERGRVAEEKKWQPSRSTMRFLET